MDYSDSKTLTYQLQIGIIEKSPAWTGILSQIGVAWEQADLRVPDPVQRYSVIIVNGNPGDSTLKQLKTYHDQGGALLDTGPYLQYTEKHPLLRKSVAQIIPDPKSPFAFAGRIDLHQKIRLYKHARYLNRSVSLPEKKKERIAFLGWNMEQVLENTRSVRKSFYTEQGHEPNEIVSKVSRSAIRRCLFVILRELYHSRNLPFVHLWPIPEGKKQFFGFRVDTDYGTRDSINALRQLADTHDIAMTWFLHVEAHRNWLDFFHTFGSEQEIALHGYHHKTYRRYQPNYDNIGKALVYLNQHRLNCEGFCAPYGLWYRQLQRAVEDWNFVYSSEFAFDYDNYPSFPLINQRQSSVLQVPIHPIGIGRLGHSGASREQTKTYLNNIMQLQFSRYEPVFLYHHPNQEGLEIFHSIMADLPRNDLCNWNMGQYARWWKKRLNSNFNPEYRSKRLIFNGSTSDTSMRAAVWKDQNRFTLLRPTSDVNIDKPAYFDFNPNIPLSVKHRKTESYYRPGLLKSGILDFINRFNS